MSFTTEQRAQVLRSELPIDIRLYFVDSNTSKHGLKLGEMQIVDFDSSLTKFKYCFESKFFATFGALLSFRRKRKGGESEGKDIDDCFAKIKKNMNKGIAKGVFNPEWEKWLLKQVQFDLKVIQDPSTGKPRGWCKRSSSIPKSINVLPFELPKPEIDPLHTEKSEISQLEERLRNYQEERTRIQKRKIELESNLKTMNYSTATFMITTFLPDEKAKMVFDYASNLRDPQPITESTTTLTEGPVDLPIETEPIKQDVIPPTEQKQETPIVEEEEQPLTRAFKKQKEEPVDDNIEMYEDN